MGCSVRGVRGATALPLRRAAHGTSRTVIVRRMSSGRAQDVDVRPLIDAATATTASPERLRCVISYQARAFAQLVHEPGRTRRGLGNTGTGAREKGGTGTTVGGVGEVRLPV